MAFVLTDPTIVDLLQRCWIEIVQFFTSAPDRGHKIGRFKKRQMLGHGLACYIQAFAQFTQRLAVVISQLIEQFSPARIRECPEYLVHTVNYMQPNGCMSRRTPVRYGIKAVHSVLRLINENGDDAWLMPTIIVVCMEGGK